MKKAVAFGFIGFILPFVSMASDTFAPNHYECRGGGLEVIIDHGRYPGPGHMPGYIMTVKEGANTYVGHDDSITVEKAVFGEILSVTAEFVPDFRTRYISVVLPRINMDKDMAKLDFNTQLIETNQMTTWAGPHFVRGLVDQSSITPLSCVATYR